MARIVIGSYMFRYPLGGMMSWVLQYLVGLHRLGHEVFFVEKAGYSGACFDPTRNLMTDDCAYGVRVVHELLARHGLGENWCFVDGNEQYHGVPKNRIEEIFRTAELFLDMGTHGAWLHEASESGMRVLLDGEPGFTQIKMEKRRAAGEALPAYDRYYTAGLNLGSAQSSSPTAGCQWRPMPHPVVTDLFSFSEPAAGAAATTVMNWQSHAPIEFQGRTYGQKDVEFPKFIELPRLTGLPVEIAVSGKSAPAAMLKERGWRVVSGHATTISFDSFSNYIRGSLAEFSVCKNVFVALQTGWFSDRAAAYLASGRPVVQQDTGFSRHLPCGAGLFAVANVGEAAQALEEIRARPAGHARQARDIACEHLEGTRVLGKFLDEIGL
ncbi:MAG TPA: hypothetical protein VN673_04320 [Clostridia bacterium]|nr:hypothetical protein [Clostridia bacterium]